MICEHVTDSNSLVAHRACGTEPRAVDRIKDLASAVTRKLSRSMLRSFQGERLFDPRSKWLDPVATALGSVPDALFAVANSNVIPQYTKALIRSGPLLLLAGKLFEPTSATDCTALE